MDAIRVFIETGKKKTFAGAADYPGWCRSDRDENAALETLVFYAPRYAQVLERVGMAFPASPTVADFSVIERHEGNASTDFGAPVILLDADRDELDSMEFEHFKTILLACWQAFDHAVQQAKGKELRKGPRGGGREIGVIMAHVLEADQAYLARLAWKHKIENGQDQYNELNRMRQAILSALQAAINGDLPEQGRRGGTIWPVRYFIRRVAWHVLDHAWEIEDRIG